MRFPLSSYISAASCYRVAVFLAIHAKNAANAGAHQHEMATASTDLFLAQKPSLNLLCAQPSHPARLSAFNEAIRR
ncbi:hypothetical protein [Paenibacillus sp. SYP-B3998]|uniref:hypothetical protein n=1 Tax=Paenibacillus sp. SYP-B3998 TaxID=2678564 RepID=UPI0013D30F36|nr:hypothetical protein [Paenibacillus sp. SYP-B3998]